MNKLLAVAIIALSAFAIWFGGIRVVVVPPVPAAPEGRTLIVRDLHEFRLVDSAQAYCARTSSRTDATCEAATVMAIARKAKVMIRLPYMSPLYALTGA
ncbi:hypothetical protein QEZ48_21040 [Aquamicrobium lusatiense]|uniref:hypothetical protein n=1 Tax=Aquamicrobium lusatiense TaxID=89772 RepID=UPI002453F065|nr:hypothetical protein [Aquamicrobium lusatiense]MDH4993299.1 hypothetical protein [Aquamicrobium lusatiense]